jgi:transposase-like protein
MATSGKSSDFDDLRGEIARLRNDIDQSSARLQEVVAKLAVLEHSHRSMQTKCPHCGHNGLRLIAGTMEGAECLSCGKTFSLWRETSS